jgi:gliding motility-associated-like protein
MVIAQIALPLYRAQKQLNQLISKILHICSVIVLICVYQSMNATHIVGGELYYSELSPNNYKVTLIVYRDCGPANTLGTGFDENAAIGIYNAGGELYQTLELSLFDAEVTVVPIVLPNPCFILPPDLCIEKAKYEGIFQLSPEQLGLNLVYQRCCRNNSIVNIINPADTGMSLWAHIPGSQETTDANSSPIFDYAPPVALCAGAEFYFDHSATDPDGDSLVYEFCTPKLGGGPNNNAPQSDPSNPAPNPPQPPPFSNISWGSGYSANDQIDSNPQFAIDAQTGFITGTPTSVGRYAIGICVKEYRNGVLIGTEIRDFQYNVTNCDPNIISSVPSQTNFCDGLTVVISNVQTNGSFFFWDFDVPFIDSDTSIVLNPTYTYADSGVYNIMFIANKNWPCADTVISTFHAFLPIEAAIGTPQFECVNGLRKFDFQAISNASDAATFSWNFGAGSTPATSSLENPQNVQLNPNNAQNTVTLSITQFGCSDEAQITINNPPDPVAGILPQESFCDGYTYQFQNNAQNAVYYSWNFGSVFQGDTSSLASPEYTFQDTGHYTITLIVSAEYTCPDTAFMDFVIYGLLNPQFAHPLPQCLQGNSFDFSATGASTPEAVYAWTFGSNVNIASSNIQSPQNISYSVAAKYPISLTISENGCTETYTDSVWVVTNPALQFTLEPQEGCPPYAAYFEGETISDTQVFYEWQFGDGESSTLATPTHIYTQPGYYDVTVSNFTNEGCVSNLTQTFINSIYVYPLPTPGFTVTPQRVNILTPDITVADSSLNAISCYYKMSDGGESNSCDFDYSWLEAGIQTITQYVTNEFGCVASVSGTVFIEGYLFYAPNTFTPDNDGVNDFWLPSSTGLTAYEIKIFDRWGEVVFESDNAEEPWTGSVKGGNYFAQNGVYNYVVKFDDSLKYPHEFVGHINVVR